VGDSAGVEVSVAVGVSVAVAVAEPSGVGEAVAVSDPLGVDVAVSDPFGVDVAVSVPLGVEVAVSEPSGVEVEVSEPFGVEVAVADPSGVGVAVSEGTAVCVAVAVGALPVTVKLAAPVDGTLVRTLSPLDTRAVHSTEVCPACKPVTLNVKAVPLDVALFPLLPAMAKIKLPFCVLLNAVAGSAPNKLAATTLLTATKFAS
jgi:hypothetical protein